MARETKRAWSRPELIVIVRGGPEEAVLWTCKRSGSPTHVGSAENGCYAGAGAGQPCTACAEGLAS